jgi:hypothetical protein
MKNAEQNEEELLLRNLEESSGRIANKANLLHREAHRQNNAVDKIRTATSHTTDELELETVEVGNILDNRRNDCMLQLGIAVNVILLCYLVLTSL